MSARHCRSCAGVLDTVLNLGAIQLSGYLHEGEARPAYPLDFCACRDCGLVQLRDTVPRELLYQHYWYRSGVNETMRAELHDVVDEAVNRVGGFGNEEVVLDIGANDGTLLAHYRRYDPGVPRVAYEPAHNLQRVLRPHAELLLADYFPEQYTKQLKGLEGKVKVITSIAMVYGVDDLKTFLTAIAALLHEDGVWVVQFQDLAGMLRSTAFDNICHEHLTYPSLRSFMSLLPGFGLTVSDAEVRAINGGSYRLYVQHASGHHPISPHVRALWDAEHGCQEWSSLERFAWRVDEVKRQIRAAIQTRVRLGQVVDLYGASTKANTLLQVCELTGRDIRQAWERSPEKVGLLTAGSHIPIVSEEDGRKNPPDALVAGVWQFRDFILQREAEYFRQGGTFIFPLPRVDVVTHAVHA